MPSTVASLMQRGMGSVGSNATGTTSPTASASLPDATPTLSEREQLKIEFYKTYDVMTGVRIAATLGGFFSLMVLLVVYKSRCKSSKQLEDPRLTAAAAAAVAEAEAEERALAAALEAIARLPPRPGRGPRRSLCVETTEVQHCHVICQVNQSQLPVIAPRFASVGGGGGYDGLLAPPMRQPRLAPPADHRRCSSITCSSTASSYLEGRGSAMAMPCLLPPPSFPRHANYEDEPWDLYYPIDIQVIQPTPDMSPCGSEAGLYAGVSSTRRAPLASMGSVDPPEPDSRSLGSDSVFLDDEECLDTEDEVSGFSTDSDAPGPSCRRFLRVPPRKRRTPEKWDGCAGCVPRRRAGRTNNGVLPPCQACLTISAAIETPRSSVISTSNTINSTSSTSSTSSKSTESPPRSPPIELRHRPMPLMPQSSLATTTTTRTTTTTTSVGTPIWSQETLF
ncbi:uncharacterized protein LOC107273173 isoform X3 [Cephus cinctus]|uniref:Uncharacterized protein LOC107273173 isoform X3 n=1 Tax=Cephus cinctus TaxID=211228 RepID=A0AAJ7RSC5_CEPCN|nr:uncharacterized protein LOC107273173 isoform X3 [Cephus cinctus]